MANYPQMVSQAWLDNQIQPDEQRIVRLELSGCFNIRPVPLHGKSNKRYVFPYDSKTSCHALNVPESIWMADKGRFARDLMSQPITTRHSLVVLVVPHVAAPKNAPKPLSKVNKKTKSKTAEEAAMAVLGG